MEVRKFDEIDNESKDNIVHKAYYEASISKLRNEYLSEISGLKEIIWRQTREIEKLQTENAALRGVLNQHSGNSSKAPSSDGYKKIHNSRAPTGRKPGGQVGHRGHEPVFFETPTEIIEVKAKKCKCGSQVNYSDGSYTKKQYVDIEIVTNITEYREYKGKCECCGRSISNRSPMKDSLTCGSKLKSFNNMLSVEGNVSVNRVSQMITEFTGGLDWMYQRYALSASIRIF